MDRNGWLGWPGIRIEHRFGCLLPDFLALYGIEFPDLAFNIIDACELLQRELGKLAFVGRM